MQTIDSAFQIPNSADTVKVFNAAPDLRAQYIFNKDSAAILYVSFGSSKPIGQCAEIAPKQMFTMDFACPNESVFLSSSVNNSIAVFLRGS